MRPSVVVLAAGLGTRMRSMLAKALHPVAGRPMLCHVLDAAFDIEPEKVVLVVGHQAEDVIKAAGEYGVDVVYQAEQLGTGHAVIQAMDAISTASGPILVLCSDIPLITSGTLNGLLSLHERSRAAVTLLTAVLDEPYGYGRILRDRSGVKGVVEEKDATAGQKKIKEVNTGIYCFDKDFLFSAISMIGRNNAQAEYYLPDMIAIARKKRRRVTALITDDPSEVIGVNTRCDLSRAEEVMQKRINQKWMLSGVSMHAPHSIFIGRDVVLEQDVEIYGCVRLEGKTRIGSGSVIYAGCRILDSTIGRGVTVKDFSVIEKSSVADMAVVGPFAHLRPGSVIESGAKIGNFVEVKKSIIGEGSKANHLSYIGDTVVGKGVNIGAGVITCNYDGFQKHKTVIEDEVFVGSDAQLVAPVRIGKGALIAAGTTVTRDVPPDALAISRPPQEIREGFASRRRRMKLKRH